jgi:hypothetical protein
MDNKNAVPINADAQPKELDLIFWVAYRKAGEKKHYLGNGKGTIRLFKSEEALREYLQPLLSPADYENVVVHSIVGQLALPETDEPKTETKPALNFTPISTLAAPTRPTSLELMQDYIKRHKGRK